MLRVFGLSALVALSSACSGESTPKKSALPKKSAPPKKNAPPKKSAPPLKAPPKGEQPKVPAPAVTASKPASSCKQADPIDRAICELGPKSSYSVKEAAIVALGRRGPAAKRAIPALLKIVERQGLVAMRAAKALKKISPSYPGAKVIQACLGRCSKESTRCSRSTNECRASGRKRCYGLRRCGCAYVSCKRRCHLYGVTEFACR